jgi:hypothetical protein
MPQGSGPVHHAMPMPIRQMPIHNGTRISNITPKRVMDESDALKLLTTYKVFTIRKVAPGNPREKATWAVAEISEEHLSQSEIVKTIKRLNESKKTVSDKKTALMPHQTGQVNKLMDDLITNERDPENFEVALVQLDSFQKDLPVRDREKKKKETVTITVYTKRAPLPDKNPVVLFHQIERMKSDHEKMQREHEKMQREHERMMQEAMRPPPQQQHPPPPPPPPQNFPGPNGGGQAGPRPGPHPGQQGPINLGKMGGNARPKVVRGKHGNSRRNRHQGSDSSSGSSYDDSDFSDDSQYDSSGTSVNTASDRSRKMRRHSITRKRSRSFIRHRPEVKTFYLEGPSPLPGQDFRGERRYSEYSAMPQRPYVPEVPRLVPTIDPISSAYQAGKEDAMNERFGSPERRPSQPPVIIERIIERPVERPVERIRPVISYGPLEPRRLEPHRLEPRRFLEGREDIIDDYSVEGEYIARRQDAEDYIGSRSPIEPRGEYRRILEPRQFARRASSPIRVGRLDRRPGEYGEEAFGRHPSISSPRMKFQNPNPFAPVSLPRRYETSSTSSYENNSGW